MNFVFSPILTASLAIKDCEQVYGVRRVYCVGRNYADHAREMGANPEREAPFFFCKPNDKEAIISAPAGTPVELPYPLATQQLDYEVELVVLIGKQGTNISAEQADEYIYGYAVGLDMTRRDLQAQMKKGAKPWEIGKAFDGAAVIGQIHPKDEVDVSRSEICLMVNGTPKQIGNVGQMIWRVQEVIAQLSSLFTLHAGDVIFTGTPAGVGATVKGDELFAHIDGLSDVVVRVV